MKTLLLDLETFAERDLKTYGTWAYAEVAEVMLLAYAWDDGPVEVVEFPSAGFMQSLIDQADQVVIQNSHFDRTVLGFMQVRIPTDKIFDTMVVALLHSLPGSLDKLCQVLAVPFDMVKDKEGKRLIQLFCKPRPKKQKIRRATKETHPAEWAEFVEYARMDIVSMREVYKRLPKVNWTPAEQALWRLDQTINDRGVQIDLDLAHAALRAAKEAGERLAVQAKDMTDGAVPSATQRDALLTYLRDVMGVDVEDLRKGTLAALLKTDVPDDVRELLEVRLQAAATSPAKYRVLTRATSEDGRLRGTIQYCGAARTGRFGGRLFQPQNLPRPSLKQPMIDAGIEAIKLGMEGDLFNDVMELCSSAVRGTIVAAPGQKLVIADLSNIEGRMLAWLAGEERKIEAFRTFDRGDGYDIYKITAGGILGKDPKDVTKDERQVSGKVPELACGYQGSVGAFAAMGAVYGVYLPEDKALAIVKAWRAKHPKTVSLWYDCERAARNAIRNPGEVYRAGKLAFRRMGGWLRMRLPSGRYLCYPSPEVDGDGRLSYLGQNQYTRKWERLDTYGGKLVENATQAASRDILAAGLMAAEAAGYNPVLHVHDEILCETPDDPSFNADGLAALMSRGTQWSVGLPLAAEGFETYRYRKED